MTQNADKTIHSMAPLQARQDEFTLPRRWQCFLMTIAGLVGFILLAVSLRAAVS